MDKSAIEKIQENATVERVSTELTNMETKVPMIAHPSDIKLTSIEKQMEHAARYRLGYETTSISDFIAYSKKHDTEGASCFVDAESMSAKAIYDLGTEAAPGHKEHTAKLSLKETAAYKAMISATRSQLGQKDASEFVEDWADNIICFSKDGATMTPVQSARSLQDLTIEAAREVNSKVDDFGASMSAMEKIEAKNQNLIPAEIHFACEPYGHFKERTFKIRVGILTGGEKPKISLRVMRLDSIREEIAEEFKDKLSGEFDELSIATFIGCV